jgi:hypothetical protein
MALLESYITNWLEKENQLFSVPVEVQQKINILMGTTSVLTFVPKEDKLGGIGRGAGVYRKKTMLTTASTTPTVPLKKKTPMEEIRLSLNKLTDKNFVSMTKTIHELLTPEIVEECMQSVFEIASSNLFFSKLYAEFFSQLTRQFTEVCEKKIHKELENYCQGFQEISVGDPDVDYDEYCKIVKINEKHRALTTFFVNLYQLGVLKLTDLEALWTPLLTSLVEKQSNKTFRNENEVRVSNLVIFFSILSLEKRKEIVGKWNIATTQTHPGLSSKSIFQLKDLLDITRTP